MKKMLLTIVALGAISLVSSADARLFGNGGGRYSSPNAGNDNRCAPSPCAPVCAPMRAACPPSGPSMSSSQSIPRCFKTIEVPALERRIENAPIRRCVKNPDIISFEEVAPVIIPQEPRRICTPVADTIWFEPVPPTVVYECPVDTIPSGPQMPSCGPVCR